MMIAIFVGHFPDITKYLGRPTTLGTWVTKLPGSQCGGGEIRTPGPVSESPVFKTGAFNHSATPPI